MVGWKLTNGQKHSAAILTLDDIGNFLDKFVIWPAPIDQVCSQPAQYVSYSTMGDTFGAWRVTQVS